MEITLGPVMVGKPQPFRDGERSSIFKYRTRGPVRIGPGGMAGDEQADKVNHGGAEMAIHHYPHDHYDFWEEELGGHELLARPGAFGENISTLGLTEDIICIGDRLRIGSAVVEVSQGRKPCWKIDHKFGRKGITRRIVETGRCGWYYRVLVPGMIAEGDRIDVIERGHGDWSVARVFDLLVAGKEPEPGEMKDLSKLVALSEDWRKKAREKLG
jgi:MOSC domain-containing protein YiiM